MEDHHPARIVWGWVQRLDLSALVEPIQAVKHGPAQAPADPRILLALWRFATLREVESARELNRLCQAHVAYRWICGGVSMNYHTPADFRTQHVKLPDRLLPESVAALVSEGLVSLDRVAQDGMKVRASAVAALFRRRPTLRETLTAAKAQRTALKSELEVDPAAGKRRERAARERAARECAERLQAALDQLPAIEPLKKPAEREKARVSITDS